jgi:transcriptional regulator with GAF, ATPase, and Fis domain
LDQRSQRLALLNRFLWRVGRFAGNPSHPALDHPASLQRSWRARSVIVLTADSGKYQLYEDDPNSAEMQLLDLPPTRLLEHLTESQGIYAASDITEENDLLPLHSYFADRQVRSLLSVPLLAGTKLYGWLWISKVETYRFSSAEVELARTISNQAAIAIQNATLFAERQRLAQDLERRVEERTIEFKREHQNTQALLKIITELSASLDLGQVLARTLGVLNESLGAEQSTILWKITIHKTSKPACR